MGSKRPLVTPFPEWHPDSSEQFGAAQDPATHTLDGERAYLIGEQPDPRRPETPIQALMEAAPFEEPETSQVELIALRDILADALDDLDQRDRRLIEARIIERRSLRSLEHELGWRKSHMQRRERVILAQLAEKLKTNPAILEYLNRHD